ncbi:MAG TPA: hypothetical protein PLW44_05650 [Chitinophagales bacterium]|nr:hypothetical protein [Chitinophagales bacterium]
MSVVICDTNIFYDIDRGAIAKAWFEKDQICGTLLTQIEFAKSPNMIDRLSFLKGAVRAMNHHCSTIIPLSPPDFTIKKFIPDYVVDPRWYWAARESFDTLLQRNFDIKIDKEIVKRAISDYEKPWTDIRLKENKRLIELRNDENHKEKFQSKEFRIAIKDADLTQSTKKDIIKDLKQYHSENYPNQPIEIDENHESWNDLEFMLNVLTDYNKRFFEKQARTVKKNDLGDLAITAYVGRNDLYWTNDEDFIDIIKANPITAKYLYHHSGKDRLRK